MSDLFIGLDLGTSAVKVGLFDAAGRLLRLARHEYPLFTPRPGWNEQEPGTWWQAVCAALHEVDAGKIAAVGLSGQAPSPVLVGADNVALGRAILWSDRRAIAQAAWLTEHITPQQVRTWTGHALIADVTQPVARLLWLKANRPDDWEQCITVIQPKDFITLQLTGRIATDHHSGYGLYNLRTGRYHADYFLALGLELDKMPPVLKPTDVVGQVTPTAAAQTGLCAGTPVIVGTIDAWCEIIGCGGLTPGCAIDVSGTSEIVALVTERPAKGEGVSSSILLDGLHWVGGPMQTGGGVLRWLVNGFYGGDVNYEQLETESESVPPGAEELLFLPYLAGERAPLWDNTARGAFVGLTGRHGRAHCTRAVYEGMAFAVRDVLERSQVAAKIEAKTLRVSGGGARSAFWNQIKADITGRPVQQMAVPEAACLGAALLAAVGVGAFAGPVAAAETMVHPATVLQPDPSRVAYYDLLFAAWRQLYLALRPTFLCLDAVQGEKESP